MHAIRPRCAFTMVELLVVLAIIAVLAAMIVPAINSVRMSAMSATCGSNLRQQMVGIIAYTNDNRGLLPTAYSTVLGSPWFDWYQGPAYSYIQEMPQQVMPPASWFSGGGVNGCKAHAQAYRYYSYIMNQSIAGHNPTSTPRRLIAVTAPDRKPLLIDARSDASTGNLVEFGSPAYMEPLLRGGFIHRSRLNAVFCDGHVEARSSIVRADCNP